MSNKLSSKKKSAHIFKNTIIGSLISMGQLCDDDCIDIFTKYDVKILKHNQVIITGLRGRTNGLWNIPLEPNPPAQKSSNRSHPNQANGILHHDTTKRKLAQYFHAAAFSPVKSNFIATINKGHFTSWPVLSASSPIFLHSERPPRPRAKEYLFHRITSIFPRQRPPQAITALPQHPRCHHQRQIQDCQIILRPNRTIPGPFFTW